ncbi:unnamed protein product [Prunus armeniaca]|uniref:Terpene synthase N-terminal domain-containing protein n=1 Tax=Prunus armeniaca TaxID=36596 RepID=A0A6J5WXE3_PRUAR|nr:unnamed protein product [Prunus armeniaca]
MMTSSPSSTLISNPPVPQRRLAQYHPTIWDHKLIDSFTTHYTYELHATRLESLKQNVAKTLLAASTSNKGSSASTCSVLKLIDSMQRLGVAYHFEKETDAALLSLVSSSTHGTADDLHTVALQFRILREHGISISPEVFNKFRSRDGSFKDSLSKDVEGLLSLYEASHLGMPGEEEDHVLEEAKSFSTKNLRQLKPGTSSISTKETILRTWLCLNWPSWIIILSNQWWRDLDFKNKASFSRDRLMENYLWAMGINYEPRFSECRIGLTKFVCILTIIDDMYDVYGFLEELEHYTLAVCRWNMEAKEELPEYMKPVYAAMLKFGNELSNNVFKNNGLDVLPYIKKEWVNLCKSYLVEARWFYGGYTPTLQEYLDNAWTSVGGPGALLHTYLLQGLGSHLTKTSLESFKHGSEIVYWSSLMTRLSDDLGTSKAESERGDVAKAVECYMEEKGTSEEEAQHYINDLICYSWKKMNEESAKTSRIPKSVVKMSLNMARTAHSIFQHGDGIGTSIGVTKDRLISLIANPIPIYHEHK